MESNHSSSSLKMHPLGNLATNVPSTIPSMVDQSELIVQGTMPAW